MPHAIGFVDNLGVHPYANRNLIAFIKTFCENNGWTINRYDTSTSVHELLMAAPGYIGPDGAVPAYVGMQSYENVASDYYNVSVAGFTGYVAANAYEAQPGYVACGVPAHNQRIDYWITVNARRLAFALKVGTPVYESGYLGFMLPYGTPRQYPYPLFVGGALTGNAATRFSDTAHVGYFKGNVSSSRLRFVDGVWKQPYVHPWGNNHINSGNSPTGENFQTRPTGIYYPLMTPVLHDNSANNYGELEGIFQITGFDNAVENTIALAGNSYVVFQDVWRTSFDDYYAMRLDPNP